MQKGTVQVKSRRKEEEKERKDEEEGSIHGQEKPPIQVMQVMHVLAIALNEGHHDIPELEHRKCA